MLIMRITGGRARGIPLSAPRGQTTRPATDALREAFYSHLGSRLEGFSVIDLFAGTGAYGLEALSRGAARATFVENARGAVSCLRQNLAAVAKSLGEPVDATVLTADVLRWRGPANLPDLVIADPPYVLLQEKKAALTRVLRALAGPKTLVALEAPGGFEPLPGTSLQRRFEGRRGDGPSLLFFHFEPKHESA